MQTYRTEGVILQACNFQDYDQILTLFTHDEGIVKLIVKGANRPKQRGGAITTPLTRLEIEYSKGRNEIQKCQSLSLLNPHLNLRNHLPALEASCEIIKSIQRTQQPSVPAKNLYVLLNRYLEKIPDFNDPFILSASFMLKILRHDGLFTIAPQETRCSVCTTPLNSHFLFAGEAFCSQHAPNGSLCFSSEEIDLMILLAYCRHFDPLTHIPMTPDLYQKIKEFFLGAIG